MEKRPTGADLRSKLAEVAQTATVQTSATREKLRKRRLGRSTRAYRSKKSTQQVPTALSLNSIGQWGGRRWFEFFVILRNDHDVPLWCDDRIEEARAAHEGDPVSEYELVQGKTFRAVATHKFIMAFVNKATEAIFGSVTKETKLQFAAFLSEGLFANWQYYRSQVLRKKDEEEFAFHPKYLTTAVDTLVTLAKAWQADAAGQRDTNAYERNVAHFRKLKETHQK